MGPLRHVDVLEFKQVFYFYITIQSATKEKQSALKEKVNGEKIDPSSYIEKRESLNVLFKKA